MDNTRNHIRHSNEIVNNIFSESRDIFSVTDPCFNTYYSESCLISVYYTLIRTREEYFVKLNETINEEDIDDFINFDLKDKIILNSDCYYKEVLQHLMLQNNCEHDIEFYVNFFYNKPIVYVALAYKHGLDKFVKNCVDIIKDDLFSHRLNKAIDGVYNINFTKLTQNNMEECIDYYTNMCDAMCLTPNIDYFKQTVSRINTANIDDLLQHESADVKDILKLCYEDRA